MAGKIQSANVYNHRQQSIARLTCLVCLVRLEGRDQLACGLEQVDQVLRLRPELLLPIQHEVLDLPEPEV